MTPGPADHVAATIAARLAFPATPTTIEAVLAVMQDLHGLLPDDDGLKWFNLLYLQVTQAVYEQQTGWADHAWLVRLDVEFAGLYFAAIRNWYGNQALVPRAWQAFLESRGRTDVQRVQWALAGMNAHINHDLALAIVQTCRGLAIAPGPATPERQDYEAVNTILAAVEPQSIAYLASGIVAVVVEDLSLVRHTISIWNIATARENAWLHAEILWALRDQPLLRDQVLLVIDRVTGLAGRALLTPVLT